jgi:hypothetical protein
MKIVFLIIALVLFGCDDKDSTSPTQVNVYGSIMIPSSSSTEVGSSIVVQSSSDTVLIENELHQIFTKIIMDTLIQHDTLVQQYIVIQHDTLVIFEKDTLYKTGLIYDLDTDTNKIETEVTLVDDRHGNTDGAYYFPTRNSIVTTQPVMDNIIILSYSFWVKFDDYEEHECSIINEAPFDGGYTNGNIKNSVHVRNYNADGNVHFINYLPAGNNTVIDDVPVALNTWIHYVIIKDDKEVTAYKNGTIVGKNDLLTEYKGEYANTLFIGNRYMANITEDNPNYTCKIALDDVQIYNKELTNDEINILYSH